MKKMLFGLIGIMFVSGCTLKSTLVKKLTPIDQALAVIETVDCGTLQVGSNAYFQCELAKTNATISRNILKELGVKPAQ